MVAFFGPTNPTQVKFENDLQLYGRNTAVARLKATKNRPSNSIDECQVGGSPPTSKLEDRIIFGIVIAAITAGAFWAVGII